MIPVYEPYLGHHELDYIQECIKDNWITGGKKVQEFQERLSNIVGVKHAIACCNGTLALYVALKALGIKEGDEVIVPDFTFIASANAVVMAGGKPVFCDIEETSLCINPEDIIKTITPQTKAIMPVGIYGNSPNMSEIEWIANSYNLQVIEDAAQDVNVYWCGKHLGSFGDIGCMSFYGDKTITTGEGGMVFTDSDQLAQRVTRLLNQGRTTRGWYVHEEVGYNFRMSDVQAAIGLGQLDKLERIVAIKKTHEQLYRVLLNGVVDFPVINDNCFNVPFRHNILVDQPEDLSKFLKSHGIGSLRFFFPLHRQPCYERQYSTWADKGMFVNTNKAYDRGLSLPSAVNLDDGKIKYICDTIRGYYEKKA